MSALREALLAASVLLGIVWWLNTHDGEVLMVIPMISVVLLLLLLVILLVMGEDPSRRS